MNSENNILSKKNNENNNKLTKVLIGIIVVIILGLLALGLYVLLNDSKEENKGNNNKEYSEQEKKVLDEYYLKTTDIIDEHILEYRYSVVANNEINYEDFRKNYIVKELIANLIPISNVGCGDDKTVTHVNDETDKNGKKYPEYCDGTGILCSQNIAKDFGLTVDEISKMDESVWSIGGQYCFNMYDAKEVSKNYPDIYKDLFSSSFSLSLNAEIYGAGYYYSYDKKLDKIITGGHSGTAGAYKSAIIDSVQEGNLYKVKFVEGYFEPDVDKKDKYVLVIDSKNSISNIGNQNETLKENQDKLSNYEIIFEKVNTGYKYKSIDKLN